MCLPYAVFGSVIWAAHHEFGKYSLANRAPLVVAERTPLKLNPSLPTDRLAPDGEAGRAARRLVSAAGEESLAGADQAGGAELAALQFGMRARAGSMSAHLTKGSIAGPEPMPGDALAEIIPASAGAEEPATASKSLPIPSFKPIEVVQAMAAAALGREATVSARAETALAPPRPALKPVVMPAREFDPRLAAPDAVARAEDSLPEALRAWWTNVQVQLASGPGDPAPHAGSDGSDRQAAQRGIARADAGGTGSEDDDGGAADRGGRNEGGRGNGGSASSDGDDGGDGGGSAGDGGSSTGSGTPGDDGSTSGGGSGGADAGGSADDAGGGTGGTSSGGGSGASTGSGDSTGRGGRGAGLGGDVGRGIGGVADSIGGIADGLGRGIGDSVGRGSSTSRGDGDRGGRGGGRGGRGDDRGGRGDGGRGKDNDRGDRGGRDGGGRGGNDRGDRDD